MGFGSFAIQSAPESTSSLSPVVLKAIVTSIFCFWIVRSDLSRCDVGMRMRDGTNGWESRTVRNWLLDDTWSKDVLPLFLTFISARFPTLKKLPRNLLLHPTANPASIKTRGRIQYQWQFNDYNTTGRFYATPKRVIALFREKRGCIPSSLPDWKSRIHLGGHRSNEVLERPVTLRQGAKKVFGNKLKNFSQASPMKTSKYRTQSQE